MIEALQARAAAAGGSMEKTMAALTLATVQGDAIEMQATLQIFPVRLTSVADFARYVTAA